MLFLYNSVVCLQFMLRLTSRVVTVCVCVCLCVCVCVIVCVRVCGVCVCVCVCVGDTSGHVCFCGTWQCCDAIFSSGYLCVSFLPFRVSQLYSLRHAELSPRVCVCLCVWVCVLLQTPSAELSPSSLNPVMQTGSWWLKQNRHRESC